VLRKKKSALPPIPAGTAVATSQVWLVLPTGSRRQSKLVNRFTKAYASTSRYPLRCQAKWLPVGCGLVEIAHCVLDNFSRENFSYFSELLRHDVVTCSGRNRTEEVKSPANTRQGGTRRIRGPPRSQYPVKFTVTPFRIYWVATWNRNPSRAAEGSSSACGRLTDLALSRLLSGEIFS
jgi:hypothetical protein